MSRITINETELKSIANFNATENTVLIPIVYSMPASFVIAADKLVVADGAENFDASSQIKLADAKRLDTKAAVGDTCVYKVTGGKYEYTVDESKLVSKEYTSANLLANDFATVLVAAELDKSYIMAHNLLSRGLTVVVKPIKASYGEITEKPTSPIVPALSLNEKEIRKLISAEFAAGGFDEFEDKNKWNIKFITTGGYHNYEKDVDGTTLATYISTLAAARGDAVALIEFASELGSTDAEVIKAVKDASAINEYTAAFFPWGVHSGLSVGGDLTKMPACFSYLLAFANSARNNANWFAAAGASRGEVPTLRYPSYEVGESLMHVLQGETSFVDGDNISTLSVRINPIMNTGVYGYRVWGNRVFDTVAGNTENASFRDFLNVRLLLCDLKKQIYHSSMRIMYEPNDDIAWFNFKALVNPLLDKMKSGRGVEYYIWKKNVVESKATLSAELIIKPIEAIEEITIDVNLTDADLEVEEA